jgi:hypothetical protein
MPWHLVGIARRLPVETRPDSRGNRICWVEHGDLAAAVVEGAPAVFAPLDHARALAAIHRHIDVLPVRYGTLLADEQRVCDYLSSRWQELCRDLDRLKGASEMGLRIEMVHPLPAEELVAPNGFYGVGSSPGNYLLLRRAKYERQDRLRAQGQLIEETSVAAVQGLYRDWRRLSPERLDIVRLAFLVERQRSEAFARRIETLNPERLGARCTCVGPLPPYSFV